MINSNTSKMTGKLIFEHRDYGFAVYLAKEETTRLGGFQNMSEFIEFAHELDQTIRWSRLEGEPSLLKEFRSMKSILSYY